MHLGATLLKACTAAALSMNDFRIRVFYCRKYKFNMDQMPAPSSDSFSFFFLFMPTQQCSRRCHCALQKEQTVRVINLKLCFLCTEFIHAHWVKAISALDLISGNDACLDLWQLSCRFSEKSDRSLVSVPICRPGCIDQTRLSRLRWHVFAQSVWRANEVEGTGCSSVAEPIKLLSDMD